MKRCEKIAPTGQQCINELGHKGRHTVQHKHECHWPTCKTEVPPAMWGCKKHWFKLPKRLRNRVWATYKPGQEITKTPSQDYLNVIHDVQIWADKNPDV